MENPQNNNNRRFVTSHNGLNVYVSEQVSPYGQPCYFYEAVRGGAPRPAFSWNMHAEASLKSVRRFVDRELGTLGKSYFEP